MASPELASLQANMAKLQAQVDAITAVMTAYFALKDDLSQLVPLNENAVAMSAALQKLLDQSTPK